jgi:TadE-like protein
MRFRSSRRHSRGQALVEFAFVAPIFFLILYGIVEFGRYVYTVQVLNNAAREGARYAIVHGSTALPKVGPTPVGITSDDPTGEYVRTVVKRFAVGVAGTSITFPTTDCVNGETSGPCWVPNNARGNAVTVTVRSTFQTLIPIVPLPTITIDGASTLVINH